MTRWSGLLQTFQRDLVATPATTVDVRPGIPGRGAATFARQAWDALHDLEAGRVAEIKQLNFLYPLRIAGPVYCDPDTGALSLQDEFSCH